MWPFVCCCGPAIVAAAAAGCPSLQLLRCILLLLLCCTCCCCCCSGLPSCYSFCCRLHQLLRCKSCPQLLHCCCGSRVGQQSVLCKCHCAFTQARTRNNTIGTSQPTTVPARQDLFNQAWRRQDSVAASFSLVQTLIRSSDEDLRQTSSIHPDCPCPPIAFLFS